MAEVSVMFETDSASIETAGRVWNVVSPPVTVLRLFDTTTWKWYVVFGCRLLSCVLALTSLLPLPRSAGVQLTVVAVV